MSPVRLLRPAGLLLLTAGVYAVGYYHGGDRAVVQMAPPAVVKTPPSAPGSSSPVGRLLAVREPGVSDNQLFPKTARSPGVWSPLDAFPKGQDIPGSNVEWLIKDPQQIAGFLLSLDERRAGLVVRSIAGTLVSQDPVAAWDWAVHFKDPAQRNQFETTLSNMWSGTAPATAIPWLLQNHPDRLSAHLADDLKTWMEQDRDSVVALVRDQPPGPSSQKLAAAYLEVLTRQDPSAAVSQLDLLPAGRLRNEIFGKAINRWASQNITEASSYASAMPSGPGRDTVIGEILGPAFDADPGSALAWAACVSNADKKELYLGAYFESWYKADPAAASDWLTKSSVDPALRRKLIAQTARQPSGPAGGTSSGSGLTVPDQWSSSRDD